MNMFRHELSIHQPWLPAWKFFFKAFAILIVIFGDVKTEDVGT